MTSSRSLRFVERFHRLDCRRAIRVAAPAMALVIVIDHATGAELSLATMYLLPIMLVSWCCGLRDGLVFAAAAIASQVVLGTVQGHPFSRTAYFAVAVVNRGASFVLIAMLTAGLRRMHERERRFARIDPLCGIANRLQFDDTIERELPRHARSHKPLCIAYLDCDDFKVVNDRLGHGEGDRLLRAIGEVLRLHVRASDLVCRIGGDEFAIVFPESDGETLRGTIGALRGALAARCAVEQWPVTFSIGVATFAAPPASAAAALAAADAAMYRAKLEGKDRVAWTRA